MIKKYLILFSILGLGIFVSCSDYLESDKFFKNRLTLDEVFSSEEYTEQWLAHTYTFLRDYNVDMGSKQYIFHCFADDMYYGDRDETVDVSAKGELSYSRLKLGEYSENEKQGAWEFSYKGIRNASIFIDNIDKNEIFSEKKKADYKAQARFVRAYYYWLLLRKYGPIPILPGEVIDYTQDYDELAVPRNTYEECANYISSEMLLAAKDLPLRRDEQSVARPTRGAALATRALVLLYAASPLANGNNDEFAQELVDDKGERLLSSEYDEEKWAKAAAAARDVMELGVYHLYVASLRTSGDVSFPKTISPPYHSKFSVQDWPNGWANIDPFESYRAVFNGTLRASESPELIFTRGQNLGGANIQYMVAHQLPRIASGWNTHGLTQKQVDAYYTDDGRDAPGKDKEIGRGDGSNRRSGYVTQADVNAGRYKPLSEGVSLQYAEREPRFYASVAYNGSVWNMTNEIYAENTNKQVFYYRGDGNGYSNTMFWLRSGIGIKKFVHPRDTYLESNLNRIVAKEEVAIRYADILLMYSEALNELGRSYTIPSWDGQINYTINRDINEIKRGILPVRLRAGLPDFEEDIYANKENLRKAIKRERQIELMGEGKRYFDLRRWKDSPIEESLPLYGCNVLMNAQQRDLFHIPVPISSFPTTFSKKMWFWPIQHSELKRNKRLTQNPGWTYND